MQHGASQDLLAMREHLEGLVKRSSLINALAYCEEARAAFPQDGWLTGQHAYIHLKLGNVKRAADLAIEALNLGTDDPMVAFVLGSAQRGLGNHAAAAEALLVAHRLMPARTDVAEMAIDEAAAAHGIGAARPVFEEVYGRLPIRGLAMAWAKRLFAEGIRDDVIPGIVSSELLSVRAWLDRAGLAPDYVGEREVVPFESPPIFGEPPGGRFKTKVPGYVTYVATLPGATIFAKSGLILMPDGAVLNDTATDERFGLYLDLPHDKTVLQRDGDRILLNVGSHSIEEIAGGVMLSGWASEHFGHWVPEYLCRLACLERHPRFAELPIIVDSDMPVQHLQYLSLIVTNPILQIPAGGGLRCGELIVASPTTFFPVHLTRDQQVPPENVGGVSVEGARLVQKRVLEKMPLPSVRNRKLYLSRRRRTWRRLLNEDEISSVLAERGFEVLYPEEMTFEDQVRMYQSASIVVAPNGSSLLNAMFASRDLVLIALSQRGLFNWGTFYGLMRELGHDLTFLCAADETGEKHADYRIEVSSLLSAIGSLLGEPGKPMSPLTKIPVARPRLPRLGALAAYIEQIDDARWYSNFGPMCEAFEARLAARFGLEPSRVCTISNATLGLELALKSAGAKAGALCLVPSWTFSASVHAVLEAGLVPCLMDVDDTGIITPDLAREALANAPGEVGAIMPVAVCGQPIDPSIWDEFSIETGIPVVLDAAPGFDGARASKLLSVVSLHATKVLGIGEGGFAMSMDPDLVKSFRLKSNFGFQGTREALTPATNGKLSEYAAAIGLAGLDEWPARRAAFQKAAQHYRDNLKDVPGVSLPAGWGADWVSTTCVATLDDPDATPWVLDKLHAARVETRAWWGRGMHTHRAFQDFPRLALPTTARLAETVIGLPFYIDMGAAEIDRVCMAMREGLFR
jgi:dTDP-4-amino-4,6-dideoxygalactose transaminase/capsular polysaccharide biosynthesis protein